MSELSRAAVEAVDSRWMIGDVVDQGIQVGDALWRVDSAGIPRRDSPGGLVVAGMGGSAAGGDLAAAAIGERARRPVRTVRGYSLDPWIDADTLVLCASYSGETEETLACYEAAGAAGIPRVALTTGGRLAEAARDDGVPVIGVPAGMQPRAAVVYMTVAALECAALCGAAPSLREENEAAGALLGELAAEWGPDAAEDSDAKALARQLEGSVPVIHGAGATAAPARRWKTQINENAESPAFASELPEAGHNEICAWERAGEHGSFAAVFLEAPDLDRRLAERIELTAAAIGATGASVERVPARGESPVEQVLSLVLLGDLVSVYLAVLGGRDPTPVEAIARLKARAAP